jgi:hypothetical protein
MFEIETSPTSFHNVTSTDPLVSLILGEQGPEGPAGPAGTTGQTGPQGIDGPQGPTGLQGVQGATGPEGPQGPTGQDGTNGTNGATGPAGPTGATGSQGPAGTNGTDALLAAPVTEITGTAYTLVLGDANGYKRATNAAGCALTVPPNSSVAFPIDTVITFEQAGAASITLTPGAGVSLNSRSGLLATAGQYAVAQIKKVAADTWTVIGDVS